MIVPIVPVVSKNVHTIGTKRYSDDRKRPERLRRIWKRSQTTETIGMIEGYPEVITFVPVIENNFGPDGAEAEKIIHKFLQRVWGLFEIKESP